MNVSEILVLLLLAVGVVAAIRRNLRKGMPCECGGGCASLRSCLKRRNGCRSCDGRCGGAVDSGGGNGV